MRLVVEVPSLVGANGHYYAWVNPCVAIHFTQYRLKLSFIEHAAMQYNTVAHKVPLCQMAWCSYGFVHWVSWFRSENLTRTTRRQHCDLSFSEGRRAKTASSSSFYAFFYIASKVDTADWVAVFGFINSRPAAWPRELECDAQNPWFIVERHWCLGIRAECWLTGIAFCQTETCIFASGSQLYDTANALRVREFVVLLEKKPLLLSPNFAPFS